jgi:high affinity Mn2+ porin
MSLALLALMPAVAGAATLADALSAGGQDAAAETWSLHAQATTVVQFHPSFRSDYAGANSLDAGNSGRETFDVGLYAGVRLWHGAEAYLNPEIDQGFGLSNTVGLAGFSSGEAYKVGARELYFRLPRWFLRQSFAITDEREAIAAGPNQLAGEYPVQAIVVTVGRFSVVDLFDANRYAHDPRADFLNWAVIEAGAFDYAADAWGYSYGAVAEWDGVSRSARVGAFALSRMPNGKELDPSFKQFALIGEVEQRYAIGERPGKVRLLAFANRGRMARYDRAVALAAAMAADSTPATVPARRVAFQPGVALNVEQQLRGHVGVFARASANEGSHEAFEFTEINRSVSGGVSIDGAAWGRGSDTAGLAVAVNGLSSDARRYLAAGGMGILIGDGALRDYGLEKILETYYSMSLGSDWAVSADVQYIDHPAYNRDRGPVCVFGLRLHWSH